MVEETAEYPAALARSTLPGAGAWQNHRILRRLIDSVAWVTWREVAIDDLNATATGPVLLVANHFGGVSDAIVLMSVLPRRPRVLADDQIWKVPVIRSVMNGIGAIPVHRGNRGSTDNTDMFASAQEALARGEMVLIFPEGITREEPSIGKVRSGAARIAVGAREAGVKGVRIVPAGIHYEDKAAFRSAVFVREGEPIDVDAEVAKAAGGLGGSPEVVDTGGTVGDGEERSVEEHGEERRSVERLTSLIEESLRASAPDYDDWREARALQTASEAFLRSLEPQRPVPVGLRDRLASWLAAREPQELTDCADRYFSALDHTGATDAWASQGRKLISLTRVLMAIIWVLLLPYAALGAVAWAVPALITWLVSKIRMAPAVMATVLPLVALFLFGVTTGFWLWTGWSRNRFAGIVTVALVLPVGFAAFVVVVERGLLWLRWSQNRVMTIGGRGRRLGDLRSEMVSMVADEVLAGLDIEADRGPNETTGSATNGGVT